jgi:methyl-accepting chemotaxis protein
MAKKSNNIRSGGQKGNEPLGEAVQSQVRGKSRIWSAVGDPALRMTSRSPGKSLIKTTDLASRGNTARPADARGLPTVVATSGQHRKPSVPSTAATRRQKIEERVAAATEEMAGGITEAASAAEELRRAMEQIASGAEEAASASQETLAVAANMAAGLLQARGRAESARERTDRLQGLLADTVNQIGTWASNIKHNAERQVGAIANIEQLSQEAASIGDVTKTVGHVADQTNLLALNAAIEAARAGDHGRGFAVVADEVRALAETAEKGAREAQQLAGQIQEHVKSVAALVKVAADDAAAEADKSQTVILALGELRKELGALAEDSKSIAIAMLEAEAASREARKGAEIISSAAEEQATAAAEALRSVEQQTAALEESQSGTHSLAAMANDLGATLKANANADHLASAAEQLSTAVQEISGAATQIMAATEQISRAGQQQAAATQEASAALDQIEKIARSAHQKASSAFNRAKQMQEILAETSLRTGELSAGVTRSLETTRRSLGLIAGLEAVSRNVEKIVDGIGIVSIQTNMLAVSGSVEAARTGEFGKGFAVVSKDIRNLARDSSDSAGRIKDTLRAIQDRIIAVRRELEQTIAATEAENQKNVGVLASLGIVETDMNQIAVASQEILTGAEAILSSLKEAVVGAREVAVAAERATNAATQAATAAKQQARGADDLAAAIEEIASLAVEIQRRNG